MSTIVYSETIHHFEDTSQAIDHFASLSTENGEGKFSWKFIISIAGVVAIVCGLVYLSKRDNNQAKETPQNNKCPECGDSLA